MAKEKFNWKGLFINDEGAPNEEISKEIKSKSTSSTSFPEKNTSGTKFPSSTPKVVTPTNVEVSGNVLNTIIEMYESGFESLNRPGYDFYEFFKAIKAVGSNDPSVYKMALTMAQSVDQTVTKKTLLSQADFYLKEIDKVHQQYAKQGNTKKSQIENAQQSEKQKLTNEISSLERQLMEIQNQISVKKNELQSVDSDLLTEISEIDQKIVANDTARTKIMETIVNVVDGIKNNI